MNEQVVYLMRGLPACGKSYTASKLAGESGVALETDLYFYTEVGNDPQRYDYREELMPAARDWNFQRFILAVKAGRSPIVVDRGNGLNAETQRYARYAVDHGYAVQLREPESPWWLEIRTLLRCKAINRDLLGQWADRLAELSRASHRVPAETIRRWMYAWKLDLTVKQILDLRE